LFKVEGEFFVEGVPFVCPVQYDFGNLILFLNLDKLAHIRVSLSFSFSHKLWLGPLLPVIFSFSDLIRINYLIVSYSCRLSCETE
jgi:hypothetical protein